MFGCALLFFAPVNRAEHSSLPFSAAPPAASPTVSPSPTAPSSDTKRPNVVRRFFSWVMHGFNRLFRRSRPLVISDPPFVSITASASTLIICPPNTVATICSEDRKVELSAIAPIVDTKDQLLFTWAVTAGRLSGEGRKVTWDLSDVAQGAYTATVEMNDGRQHTATASTKVIIAVCTSCDPPPPPCPVVLVSCPTNIDAKQQITFEATVTGGDPEMKPTYTWTVSAGKIISGEGTSKIVVHVTNLADLPITGTVSVGGADPSCSRTVASCTAVITLQYRFRMGAGG